jgi:quercetin dioxygenase-like cupin family protein
MLPEDEPIDSAATVRAGRAARFASSADSALGEEDGIAFWRGFDPSIAETGVFLARAKAAAGTRIPPHWHSQDTVAYLLDGRALFRSGDGLSEVHEMEAGDWLFVPAGMVHAEETPDDVHGDFLYARDGGGGTTTYLDD